jgi:transposase-like protein
MKHCNKRKGWYARDFKQKAIDLAKEIGPEHAGPKLGIAAGTLRKWVWREENGQGMKKKLETPESQAMREAAREIQRLKKQNEELEKANFILRQVASFFPDDRFSADLKRSLNSSNKPKKK